MKNYIIYGENVDMSVMRELGIVIASNAVIGKNVKIFYNTCVLGSSVICDDVTIFNNSTITDSIIKSGCQIFSSNISQSEIGQNSKIGPFAIIKNNSKVGNNTRVANFSEVNNSFVGDNVNIKSLAILHDTVVENDSIIDSGKTINRTIQNTN